MRCHSAIRPASELQSMISTSLIRLSTCGAADDIVGTSTLGADPAGISAVMLGDADMAGAARTDGAAGSDPATALVSTHPVGAIGAAPAGAGRNSLGSA